MDAETHFLDHITLGLLVIAWLMTVGLVMAALVGIGSYLYYKHKR